MKQSCTFRDLIAWQKAMSLVRRVHEMTKALPHDERFGPTSRMRRSASSIASHIAEGQGRETAADFIRFLQVARGSSQELSTQAEVCGQLKSGESFESIIVGCEEVGRNLGGLIRSLQPEGQGVQSGAAVVTSCFPSESTLTPTNKSNYV